MESLLELNNVHAGYGPIEVLHGISLKVLSGEIVTMIGANGAGKTSTLMLASGLRQPRAGTILFEGEDIKNVPAHELVKRGLAHVPEGRKIFPRLTVMENLELGAYLQNDAEAIASEMERVFTLFPVLKERRKQNGGTLSGGEQQMLAIGRALMSRPKMLLMDEPSMGVAPILVAKIFETIKTLNQEGISILLVEQKAHMALKLAGRGYVIETGKIVLEGEAAKLAVDPGVREAYLGD